MPHDLADAGHYRPETTITLLDDRIDPPTLVYNLTDAGNNFGKEVQKMVAAIKDYTTS